MNSESNQVTAFPRTVTIGERSITYPGPLWDFDNKKEGGPETMRKFVEYVMMTTSCDYDILTGIALILEEVKTKKNVLDVADFCDDFQREIFRWSKEFDEATDHWLHMVRNGIQTRTND